MSAILVAGAGSFGTALAVVLAQDDRDVTLWARNREHVAEMRHTRENTRRLPGIALPERLHLSADSNTFEQADTVLLAMPAQTLSTFLSEHADRLRNRRLVACAKGVDLKTGLGPAGSIEAVLPGTPAAVLTGPSFAIDIAHGLPTALTLACADHDTGAFLQEQLSTAALRLYLSGDVRGAELGGALKNVIAIACGIVIGVGLGESARAALMTRGYAEMLRLALARGAQAQTLAGLSGFGDLVLTCTSDKSRNFRFGRALGTGEAFPEGSTVEGRATARAVVALAREHGLEMPITEMVAAILDEKVTIARATHSLLTRPLKEE